MKIENIELVLLAKEDWTPKELARVREELERDGKMIIVLPTHKSIGLWRQAAG